MHGLSEHEVLAVWEQGESQSMLQRALLLLAITCPERSLDELANLSIGQRDDLLFALRQHTFGPALESIATCPACGARVEMVLDISDLRTGALPTGTGPFDFELAGYAVRFRLPNSHDLSQVARAEEFPHVRQRLLEQCVETATYEDADIAPANLPPDVLNVVMEKMAAVDPQADIQLALTCPECDHAWQLTFDIASYFWQEISARARHILREVHSLARAYHWCEADILALSPWRRRMYLEMVFAHE